VIDCPGIHRVVKIPKFFLKKYLSKIVALKENLEKMHLKNNAELMRYAVTHQLFE